jgi:hypothetical protein
MMGLHTFGRASDGSWTILTYHPAHSPTWYWSVSWDRIREGERRHIFNLSLHPYRNWMQRHDVLCLFGQRFRLSRQRYHKTERAG